METILCSAIWYKDMKRPSYNPINITEGGVLCGHRHTHVISQMYALTGKRTVTFGEDSVGEHVQGFLTNQNRFVDRIEAAQIALEAKQISELKYSQTMLYSEDLY